jgi:hypothetical protein
MGTVWDIVRPGDPVRNAPCTHPVRYQILHGVFDAPDDLLDPFPPHAPRRGGPPRRLRLELHLDPERRRLGDARGTVGLLHLLPGVPGDGPVDPVHGHLHRDAHLLELELR